MKQVNMRIDDELYMLLVKEAARMQIEQGKVIPIGHCAIEIMKKHLSNGNSSPSQDTPLDNEQGQQALDDKQVPANIPPETPTEESTNPFDDLDF